MHIGLFQKLASALAALTMLACLALACGRSSPGSATSARAPGPDVASPLELLASKKGFEILDLTHPLSTDSLYWPTGTAFEHRRLDWGVAPGGYWYASAEFKSPEHLGTHLDAPLHFAEHGWPAADIPSDRFLAPGIVVDIGPKAAAATDAVLQPDDLTAWERTHGRVPAGAIVIVRTGWAARWSSWNDYYGSPTPHDVATLHFPGVSREGAEQLVERSVAGVGIDTASIDPGSSRSFEAHRELSAANIFNLENLTNVDALPETGFVVIALPMKIADGTGGPAHVIALVPSPAR